MPNAGGGSFSSGSGGRPPMLLTSDLAVSGYSIELLAVLVAECGCQLSMRGLRFLAHKWEEVPQQRYGGAQVCQRRPHL